MSSKRFGFAFPTTGRGRLAAMLPVLLLPCATPAGAELLSFSYTGASQDWVVPAGVTSVTVRAWGAQGGSSYCCDTSIDEDGGLGGYATGELAVTPGETLEVVVGGQAAFSESGGTGGFNGGGDFGEWAGGGGGASDVRQGGTALANRVLVAGGGGGGNCGCPDHGAGGNGGGLTGSTGSTSGFVPGGGGTQVAGGTAGSSPGQAGTLGLGGGPLDYHVGGGGGGYYGGGGAYAAGGGGGSSFLGGVTGGSTTGGVRSGDGVVEIEYPSVCGNSTVESGEQCDDGGTAAGDCCSASCQFEAENSPCAGDGNACTQDACDGAGSCESTEAPLDVAECIVATRTKLQLKDSATEGKDQLQWQWQSGAAFDQAFLGTPLVDTDYTLCVYDTAASIPSVALKLDVPASALLWQDLDPKGAKYKDKAGSQDGVTQIQIKPGADTKTKVKLKAKGANLVLPGPVGDTYFAQDPNVVAQLVNSEGQCWTTAFVIGDTAKNDTTQFKGQTK